MNQKGFSTVLSLCLVLVMAIIVCGIQEAEKNHFYETDAYGAEFYLQNAADSAIVAAVDKIISGDLEIPRRTTFRPEEGRQTGQIEFLPTKTFHSELIGDITVRTWGERVEIHPYKVSYNVNGQNIARKSRYNNKIIDPIDSYIFFSVAEAENPNTGEKIYRRAYAYVPVDNFTINFMEFPQSTYRFQDN